MINMISKIDENLSKWEALYELLKVFQEIDREEANS